MKEEESEVADRTIFKIFFRHSNAESDLDLSFHEDEFQENLPGGGTPSYKPYRYVLPHWVGFCAVLG